MNYLMIVGVSGVELFVYKCVLFMFKLLWIFFVIILFKIGILSSVFSFFCGIFVNMFIWNFVYKCGIEINSVGW